MSSLNVKDFFEGHAAEREAFVHAHVKGPYKIAPLTEDWASRRYFRVRADGRSYVLLESVPDHIPTATMGHKLSAFIKIARMLHDSGIHTPDILAVDEREGFVLLEDLGDVTVNRALDQESGQKRLYEAATDVLISMRDQIDPCNTLNLPKYKDSYIRKGRQRIVDWYIPAIRKEMNGDDLLSGYLAAWDDVTAVLPSPQIGFIHGDFHPGNLMLLPDDTCGVLDFQDAMWGPAAYDLVNLLENIRRDVPDEIKEEMIIRYGGGEEFRAWFRVMGTQFHCRIIGQVLRLAIVSGKSDLLKYMPRIQKYLIEGLKDPILAPLAKWMRQEDIDLTATDFDPDKIKPHIRSDAF